MAKNKFEDPLKDIDPVMEEAFSSSESLDIESADAHSSESGMTSKSNVSQLEFPELEENRSGHFLEKGLFSNIPIEVSVELGRSVISLKEIYDLSEGAIIELDRLVGEPLNLVVNGQIIAYGEVVAIDNNFGLRIKSIVSKPKFNE